MSERFQGELDAEKVRIENKPGQLDIDSIHLDGDLLILQGQISRYGKVKDVIWVYKRIKG